MGESRFRDSVSLEIDTDADTCFRAMADFGSYPEWQAAVKRSRVRSRRPNGAVVEYGVGLLIREVRYVLDYTLHPERRRIEWAYVEGDAKDIGGYFEAQPLGRNRCRAVYALDIDPGFHLPGPLVSRIKSVVMKGVLKDLKKRVGG